ncbi:MAG: hypothetical protein ACRCUT_12005, partial [Spirochaetota bacterium]
SHALILNVDSLNAAIVRGYTRVAERIKEEFPAVESAFLYHDPSRSKYYFESSIPESGMRIKQLFGRKYLSIFTAGIRYSFKPAAFSQVNLSITEDMLRTAESLLSHGPPARLIDLYCGYGFFSCYLAPSFNEVIGIDYEYPSIESARVNMEKIEGSGRREFHARRIEPETLAKTLPKKTLPEYIIMDPPRKGCAQGVISAVASRCPEKVLHIFCGMDSIPGELSQWKREGYTAVEAVPLDMFPGTPNLEVMVLLDRRGRKG